MKTKTQICFFLMFFSFHFFFCHFAESILRILPPLELELEPESVSVSEPEPNPVKGRTRSSFAKVLRNLCNNLADFSSFSLLQFQFQFQWGVSQLKFPLRLAAFLSHFYSHLHLFCGIYLGIKFIVYTQMCFKKYSSK